MPTIIRITILNAEHCKYQDNAIQIIAGIYVFSIFNSYRQANTSTWFPCHLLMRAYSFSGVAMFLGEILCILRAYSLG